MKYSKFSLLILPRRAHKCVTEPKIEALLMVTGYLDFLISWSHREYEFHPRPLGAMPS